MQNQRYLDVAQRMQLLHVGEGAGVVYWQPAGLRLYENLRSYIRAKHRAARYLEVKSPSLVAVDVFERSGHLEKYRGNMFLASVDGEHGSEAGGYALRPMSCPNHIVLFESMRRSYRELPLRFFEFGEVFRAEPSGSLRVLFRQRQFCQDDSHVFVDEGAVMQVVGEYLRMARDVYLELGFESVDYAISLRPERRFGSEALWDSAEEALRSACRDHGVEWGELSGGGAFYGPKIELQVKDKLGRSWQMGVLQLDYVLPERFNLSFQGASGSLARPVILHHAVLGSLERMIGILLEMHGSRLPAFLHPYPAVVVAVSEKSQDYAGRCVAAMLANGKEVIEDKADDPLGARLRRWKQLGARRIFVVGEFESAAGEKQGCFLAVDADDKARQHCDLLEA
ncbi:aminoacyl--tRNA ligase-related protein [Variovorax sp. GT1P44]|uniref:aminoacyl--tRNA ligase-related protein n=1 Tax=Variovorax sp. GT1P44 TaxID=3443742 RepID=UPI003F48776E